MDETRVVRILVLLQITRIFGKIPFLCSSFKQYMKNERQDQWLYLAAVNAFAEFNSYS